MKVKNVPQFLSAEVPAFHNLKDGSEKHLKRIMCSLDKSQKSKNF
jgi:hypothetical protein